MRERAVRRVSAGGGTGITPQAGVEDALRQVAPGRFDTYEALLRALGEGQVLMLLFHGTPGSPDAQYGNMDVGGHGYAPCVTSPQELAASGWNRAHEVVAGRDIATELYQERWGLWLNPHAPGGGVGVPWADLRRIAVGLDRVPAGPLTISEPALHIPQFYAALAQNAHLTAPVRSLRCAWVQPAIGEPYLAVGLDVYDTGPASVEAVRIMMEQSLPAAPAGLPVSTVAMADDFDPVAMWMRVYARPVYDREGYGAGTVPGGVNAPTAAMPGGWLPAAPTMQAPAPPGQAGWPPRPY